MQELSDKEQKLFEFIKEKSGVDVKSIEKELGLPFVGALGKLLQKNLIESNKIRKNDTGSRYGVKFVKCYRVKVEEKKENEA